MLVLVIKIVLFIAFDVSACGKQPIVLYASTPATAEIGYLWPCTIAHTVKVASVSDLISCLSGEQKYFWLLHILPVSDPWHIQPQGTKTYLVSIVWAWKQSD